MSLDERISQLEQSNRRLRYGMLTMVAALVVVAFVAADRSKAVWQDKLMVKDLVIGKMSMVSNPDGDQTIVGSWSPPGTIACRTIAVLTANDEPRIVLSTSKQGAEIRMKLPHVLSHELGRSLTLAVDEKGGCLSAFDDRKNMSMMTPTTIAVSREGELAWHAPDN